MHWRVLRVTTITAPPAGGRYRPALEGDQQCVHDIAAQYKRRRDVLVKGLHEAGWMVEMPKASMYVWAKSLSLTRRWGHWRLPKAVAGRESLRLARALASVIMAIPMYGSR